MSVLVSSQRLGGMARYTYVVAPKLRMARQRETRGGGGKPEDEVRFQSQEKKTCQGINICVCVHACALRESLNTPEYKIVTGLPLNSKFGVAFHGVRWCMRRGITIAFPLPSLVLAKRRNVCIYLPVLVCRQRQTCASCMTFSHPQSFA